MRVTSQQPSEWVDGFLFVRNLLVLDFLKHQTYFEGRAHGVAARRRRARKVVGRVRDSHIPPGAGVGPALARFASGRGVPGEAPCISGTSSCCGRAAAKRLVNQQCNGF